jgi:two-component system chemotaxis response regulator CheY
MSEDLLLYKVLIVDDHFLPQQIVANVVRGLKVATMEMASNGEEARLAMYKALDMGRPFDIVFLDWDMPAIEGIDILKHFRAHPKFNKTAFIMLTAEAEQANVLEAVKAGATSYITKPASKETIQRKFLEAIEWVKKQRIASGPQKATR